MHDFKSIMKGYRAARPRRTGHEYVALYAPGTEYTRMESDDGRWRHILVTQNHEGVMSLTYDTVQGRVTASQPMDMEGGQMGSLSVFNPPDVATFTGLWARATAVMDPPSDQTSGEGTLKYITSD